MQAIPDRVASGTAPNMSNARANYILGLVTFSFCLAYIDRQLLNLLIEPIKQSLAITDTEFSLIQGTAFVTAYLAAAPIFGRLVDIANRRNIIILGVFSWSIFTALSGFCDTYGELFLARMGVGLTEACIFPAAWSLIGDCFSARRQPRAFSVFMIGAQFGGGLSLIAGGMLVAFAATLTASAPYLAGLEPWQMSFVVMGVPGLIFIPILLTIKEPDRTRNVLAEAGDGVLSMREVRSTLWASREIYIRMYVATSMVAIVQLAIPSWFPAFMMRAHGLTVSETGLKLGLISAIVGPVSTLLGPVASDWLRRRGHYDAPLRASAWCIVPMILFSFMIPLVSSPEAALAAAAGVIFCCGFPVGLMAAATQLSTPSRMRGVVASIYTFVAQLVGYMIGPTLVALLTDNVFRDPAKVGYSMQIVMTAAAVIACFSLFTVRPHFARLVRNSEDAVVPDGPNLGAAAAPASGPLAQ